MAVGLAVLLITADRGLAGAFNANLTRAGQHFLLWNGPGKADFRLGEATGEDRFHLVQLVGGDPVGDHAEPTVAAVFLGHQQQIRDEVRRRVDVDVRGLALEAAQGLVDHHARMGQAEPLSLGAAGQKQGPHAGGLADAHGADIGLDDLQTFDSLLTFFPATIIGRTGQIMSDMAV